MTTQVQTADWMKTSKPSQAFAALDPQESLAEGIGTGYPVIGYKGKIWSIRVRGENHLILRPDDGSPVSYLDVIILRQAKVKAKSYYLAGEYDEHASAGKRPMCASIDGVRPDPDVQQQQSTLCGTCPRNEWHTDTNGKKTRECADYKRLAVLILPNQTVRLFGQPLMEPAFLRVPPASLNALAVFGDNMAQQGWPFSSFITRVQFDPTKSHPEFVFKALQALTDSEAATVLGMREDLGSRRITGEDEIECRALIALPVAANARVIPPELNKPRTGATPPPPNPAPAAAKQAATVSEALPNPGLGLGSPDESAPSKALAPPQTVDLTQATQGGAFALAPPAEPNPDPQPGAMVGQTADDVGEATEDSDLDARIAAMLNT